ncbi:MAG: hypothetical protein ACXWT0_16905, partial [Methylobacter sp.]
MMELSKEIIQQAYLLLKSYAYHENLNIFLKNRVSAFECGDFEAGIDTLQQVLNSDDPFHHPSFTKWIELIDFRLLPKSIIRPEERKLNEYNKAESKNGFFLSNVSVSQKYESQKINYLIDAPVELHILDVLWCTVVGSALEEKLTQDCYGNRLHQTAKRFLQNIKGEQSNCGSGEIFKRYIDQYSAWRDQAINCATELAEDGNDVALLSIDLKSYFYHIEVDFEEIHRCINDIYDDKLRILGCTLTKLLEAIFTAYKNLIHPTLRVSHPDCSDKSG